MASAAIDLQQTAAPATDGEVSLLRLYVLRAAYLILILGIGGMVGPEILSHPLASRGVIAALLGGVGLLALIGLRYPLQMLPLLMFEFSWKLLWVAAYGYPQWAAGALTPVTSEDLFNTMFGVILMPLVIPWGYVWRHYVRQPGARWS